MSRRPPAILLSVIAATAVILPWAIRGIPESGTRERATADDTLLAQQPLTGVGGGVTIREVSQPTPFSMVALTGSDLTGTSARVRAKRADGSWGPWYETHNLESNASDTLGGGPSGTDPVFIGTTTAVQIAVTRPLGAPTTTAPPVSGLEAGKDLGYVPVNVEHSFSQNISAVLITPPKSPVDMERIPVPTAALAPGQPPNIISRAQWGADEGIRCEGPTYGAAIRAAVVHHTAGSNDYAPEDSASIIRSIYAYHTRTLGWCDIAYNAMVDKYGQVFEGRSGGITKDVLGAHTGGFNSDVWGVAMMGDFVEVPPTDIQLRTTGRLLGWRMGLDHVNPVGAVQLTSAGGPYTVFPLGSPVNLPTIFAHRDVDNTECPGAAAYAALPLIRDIAARFNRSPDIVAQLQGGAIYAEWEAMGGKDGPLGAPTSPESAGEGATRYATFERGAIYWSPTTGAQPLTGAIYQAWAALGYERGALGLPTSAEIQEPQWVVQNFQHGTLNFDRETHNVLRVIDGLTLQMPPPPTDGPPVQLERFSRVQAP